MRNHQAKTHNGQKVRCPECHRVWLRRWPEDVGAFCQTCGNPNQLPAEAQKKGEFEARPAPPRCSPAWNSCSLTTEPKEVLLSIDYLMALALRLDQLGLSRLRTADWLAGVLSDTRYMHTA